jgi:hypothetical protein
MKTEQQIKEDDAMLSLPSDAVAFVEWILPLYRWQYYNAKWWNRYTLKEETTQSCYEIFKRTEYQRISEIHDEQNADDYEVRG